MTLGTNFNDFINAILTGIYNFRFIDIVDIIIITLVLYWLTSFFRKLGASQLLRGLITVFLAAYFISNILELTVLSWLLDKFLISGILFVAILFQPELRRALDHLGRQRHLSNEKNEEYNNLLKALKNLSQRSVGALVLIERNENLQDIIDSGVKIDSLVATELIENIFIDKSPLHDGAIVIRGGRIEAASCIIPLVNKLPNVPQKYGTRHRAAVSATMKSDCIAIVCSEETGKISYSKEGALYPSVDFVQLSELLSSLEDNAPEISNPITKNYNKFIKKIKERSK